MQEQVPTNTDDFFAVQVVGVVYVLVAVGITLGLVQLWTPPVASVHVFLGVCAALSVPFFPLIRRFFPEH